MQARRRWPTWDNLRTSTKGRYCLHSQTVQAVARSVQVAFANAKLLRKIHPEMGIRYPYREKRNYALMWPAQAVEYVDGLVSLPMGRRQADLELPVGRELPFVPGACKLVWRDGWELHVASAELARSAISPGIERATGDLGEIHQIAVVASTGKALVVSGRGIRSVKRRRCMELAHIASLRSRCKLGSRRDKRLARARRQLSRRTRYQVRDLRHKGLRKAVSFCVQEKVGSIYVGNPDGVRRRKAGAVHNGRMSRWEYGLDLKLLEHKCALAGIEFASGTERGTSSHCPVCQHPQRPTGRNFTCRKCGVTVHRDVMGGVNQHRIGFGCSVPLPSSIKYLRPGGPNTRQGAGNEDPALVSSSRPDTGLPAIQGQLSCGAGEPVNRFAKTASDVETGIQALAEVGRPPTQQECASTRPKARFESQEACPQQGCECHETTVLSIEPRGRPGRAGL